MSIDSYKAKVMRRMLPPPYRRDRDSGNGALLGVIGRSDNLIGGLFGADDFEPDDPLPAGTPSGPVRFVGATTTGFVAPNAPAGDVWVFPTPPGIQAGDLLILVIGSASPVTPNCRVLTAGWSTPMLFLGGLDNIMMMVAARTATGSEPATLTVTLSESLIAHECVPAAFAYRGAGMPVPGSMASVVSNIGDPFICPAQTPTGAGDMYFGIGFIAIDAANFSAIPGNVRASIIGENGGLAVFDIAGSTTDPFPAQALTAGFDEGSTHSFIIPKFGLPDPDASAIRRVRRAMLTSTAWGQYLDALGNNRNVPRPENTSDDELYRRLIKVLAWLPKSGLLSYYALIAAVFGSQEAIRAQIGRPWRVYEVNVNEVIIELPAALIAGNLESSTYLHGASGYARVAAGPANTFTTDFDLRAASAVPITGLPIQVETAPGTWTAYTVAAYSFNAGTGVATVQVSAATLPAGGGRFYLQVPGDGFASYRGDYLATSGIQTLYSTAAGPATNTLAVVGDVTRDVVPGVTALISVSGAFQTRVVSSLSYSPTTNTTTVVITTADVPGGQSRQVFSIAQEVADTAITPAHADRVYLTGTGLYQIVKFYLDLLVRAAGVVVRLEIV